MTKTFWLGFAALVLMACGDDESDAWGPPASDAGSLAEAGPEGAAGEAAVAQQGGAGGAAGSTGGTMQDSAIDAPEAAVDAPVQVEAAVDAPAEAKPKPCVLAGICFKCQDECVTCSNIPGCAEYVQCLTDCPYGTCDCDEKYPNGLSDATPLMLCYQYC